MTKAPKRIPRLHSLFERPALSDGAGGHKRRWRRISSSAFTKRIAASFFESALLVAAHYPTIERKILPITKSTRSK